MQHTHISAVGALTSFVAVLVLGTAWRLSAMHLAISPNPTLREVGKAMAVQY